MHANDSVCGDDGRRSGPRGTVAVTGVETARSGDEVERRVGPEGRRFLARPNDARLGPRRRLENELHPLAPGAVHDVLARAGVLDDHGEQLFDGLERRAAVIEHHADGDGRDAGRTHALTHSLNRRSREIPRNHSTRPSGGSVAGADESNATKHAAAFRQ